MTDNFVWESATRAWFTLYRLNGTKVFIAYEVAPSKMGGVLTARMPLCDLMDADMLTNGFNFDYVLASPRMQAKLNNNCWVRGENVTYVPVDQTVPSGFTEFMGQTRARMLAEGKQFAGKHIRMQNNGKRVFVHKDDLPLFWGDVIPD